MIEFNTAYSFTQVPYATYEALEGYALDLIKDYAPQLLHFPNALDIEDFVRSYLGMILEYIDLKRFGDFRALTVFHDSILHSIIADGDDQADTISIPLQAGTLLIDSSLTLSRERRRYRYTLGHESSHWLLHRRAFAKGNPFSQIGIYGHPYLAASQSRTCYRTSQKERDDHQRMENQANYLSAALLMPQTAVEAVCRNYFQQIGETPRLLQPMDNPKDKDMALVLAEICADVFDVSKQAAGIRLERLRYLAKASYYPAMTEPLQCVADRQSSQAQALASYTR